MLVSLGLEEQAVYSDEKTWALIQADLRFGICFPEARPQ